MAVLFAGSGSVTPGGAVTVAVLTSVPAAVVASVPRTVKVAVPPTARFTVAARLPLPPAGQLLPAEATQVHVTPVSATGSTSFTLAPVTALGPLLRATMT